MTSWSAADDTASAAPGSRGALRYVRTTVARPKLSPASHHLVIRFRMSRTSSHLCCRRPLAATSRCAEHIPSLPCRWSPNEPSPAAVGLVEGPGPDVFAGAEAGLARLQAQQAQEPAVGAGDGGPPLPRAGHGLVDAGQAGPRRYRTAGEPPQRRRDGIGSLAVGEVVAFNDGLQV